MTRPQGWQRQCLRKGEGVRNRGDARVPATQTREGVGGHARRDGKTLEGFKYGCAMIWFLCPSIVWAAVR